MLTTTGKPYLCVCIFVGFFFFFFFFFLLLTWNFQQWPTLAMHKSKLPKKTRSFFSLVCEKSLIVYVIAPECLRGMESSAYNPEVMGLIGLYLRV